MAQEPHPLTLAQFCGTGYACSMTETEEPLSSGNRLRENSHTVLAQRCGLTVQVPDAYDLQDESSPTYQDFWETITKFFENAFNGTDYKQTVIYTVSTPSPETRTVQVAVKVVNIFEEKTTETESSVSTKIKTELEKNPRNILVYSSQDQCEYYGCKNTQDNCSSSSNCECKDGLQRPYPQSRFCIALQCSADCKAENNKQCLKQRTGKLECVCLPGYKMDSSNCQKCPFGYSGMNCEDQFQLILTIVGTILGVFVLSLVIALIVTTRSTNRKKNTEEQHLIENDFQNLRLQQTGFSNLGAGGSLFPEVKTEASRGYRSSNPYINQ
ncbi:mucin-13 [Octodon degus]|uniref:Mucin-13 n=1 Tax=Octodon degus TaxID=10160 RepID=A0A6P6DCZ3_OCTDE|nr:mucin-13 [Octodon degus]